MTYPEYDARLKPHPSETVTIASGELERLDRAVRELRGLTTGFLRELGAEMPQRTARAAHALGVRADGAAEEIDTFLRRARGRG
ncbi:hypothetical protein [Cellulomonas sp.]|uniref:hypothetical protein n=1 Tax=Cellulomonas sp. TaxID=40001 RepID=UPI003BAC3C47